MGWNSSSKDGAAFERESNERDALLGDETAAAAAATATANGQPEASGSRSAVAGGAYGSVLDLPPEQRVPKPKKVRGPVRVEAKVWFANERTWISWLRVSLLIGSFSLAMYNSASFFTSHPQHPFPPGQEPGPGIPWTSPNASTIRLFAVVYALISVLTLSWGLFNYHRRLYLIKTKYAGDFDDMYGPPLISAALFVAVLLNFIVRVQQHNLDLPNDGQI